jgi:hypothetical protein
MHFSKSISRLCATSLMTVSALAAFAVPVKITLGNMSPYMNLTEKSTGNAVDVGSGFMNYTLNLNSGEYTLELLSNNANRSSCGTIQISIPEESVSYTDATPYGLSVAMVTVSIGNRTDDGQYFQLGEDLVVSNLDVSSQQGETRVVDYRGSMSWNNVPTIVFPTIVGDSYRITVAPTEAHPTYSPATCQGTVSSVFGASANATMGYYMAYTITVPKDATLFVGKKIRHFMAFDEMTPVSVAEGEDGSSKVYTFSVSSSDPTCYYRVSMPGVMTHAGKFGAEKEKTSIVFTESDLRGHGTPDYYNHELTDNQYGNVADILLNVNKRGHLSMKMGDTKAIVANRVWQLVDDEVNNYFVEPDYHFTVLDENFQPSNAVVSVDDEGNITTNSNGTAIVLVTYDACYAHGYNNLDGSNNKNGDYDFWFGAKWSSLWAENTGIFVVTVGDGNAPDSESFVPNFVLDKALERDDKSIDSEIDVLYYLESENGYTYHYAPTGASKVEVANPIVDSEKNTLSYGEGFKAVAANEDGSYSVLLTFGRNIIRTTSTDGSVAYQVLSAKPCGYEVTNVSTPGGDIYPGDKIEVQFHGFYHPMMKLAGIYNQSASIHYANVNNAGELTQTPNQYTFAGNPSAQKLSTEISYEFDGNSLDLTDGTILVNGYGSNGGAHRDIDRSVGVNPSFNASITSEYWGLIPDVNIPVKTATGGVVLNVTPSDAEIIVKNGVGHVFVPNDQNQYILTPGTYSYSVEAEGYFSIIDNIEVGTEIIAKDIVLTKPTADQPAWDGSSVVKPVRVSAEEAATEAFSGMEGYYKVGSGYELAWIQKYVENNLATTNLVLTDDIDLNNQTWSSIGSVGGNSFSGAFEGNNHSIRNLYISGESTTDGIALIGQTSAGSTVRNLSVYGEVNVPNAFYVAGIVARAGIGVYENLANYANITAYKYVGGVIANLSASEGSQNVFSNLENHGNITACDAAAGVVSNLGSYTMYEFKNLVNTGDLTVVGSENVNTPTIGGLIASAVFGPSLTITDGYNTGDIISSEPTEETGAIIGDLMYSDYANSLTRVYYSGIVPGNRAFGTVSGVELNTQDVYAVATEDDTTEFADYVTFLPTESFENGNVAWLLRESFGQELGVEDTPVIDGERVYKVTYTSNLDQVNEVVIYTNAELPKLVSEEGYAGVWYTEKDGEKLTSVSEDSTLYVVFSENSGVGPDFADNAYIVYDGNRLTVKNMSGAVLNVYSADGASVASHRVTDDSFSVVLDLNHGVYIARCGSLSYKFSL